MGCFKQSIRNFKFTTGIQYFALIFFLSLNSFAKNMVLVPGFFNTAVPADINARKDGVYWSKEIREVFLNAGYNVFVTDNLNPVGTIEQNGQNLLNYINRVRDQFDGDGSFDVVAHSAGGLYLIYANDLETLPVNKLVTVNTPFDGVDFIESLLKYFPNFIGLIEKSLRLQSINELSPNRVRHVLANLKSKPQFPIRAYKGFQPTGYNIMDASFLSPIFYLTGVIVGLASDGVVTHSSALGKTPYLKNITPMTDDYIHLDHWKQTPGANLFRFLGMTNIDYIRAEQKRFYTRVLKNF